jgi:tRNA 2-selenouridine synthase
MTFEAAEFLELGKRINIVDVRTPAEFALGHIPGAYNIPLFTNAERAVVGIIYKMEGKDAAVIEGLKIVGPKMADIVLQAKSISTADKEILVHCWRGGMRSSSVAWLLNTAGIQAHTLIGGYKAYRHFIRQSFSRPQQIMVLGGMTGSNKTDILKIMRAKGEQFIDIEALANHRGSTFGQIGMDEQSTNEQFENNLAKEWLACDQHQLLWLEDESKVLGKVRLIDEFFNRVRCSPLIIIDKSKSLRIKHLVDEYAPLDKALLREALNRIHKRLGGNIVKIALEALDRDDFEMVAELSLNYYDKTYSYGIESRPDIPKYQYISEIANAEVNADHLIALSKEILKSNGITHIS